VKKTDLFNQIQKKLNF